MSRRSWLVLLGGVVLLVGLFSTSLATATKNLANNPSFETGVVTPDGWVKAMWDTSGVTEHKWENTPGHSGKKFVTIINHKPNHAYYSQTIKVKPNTIYRLSCWIKTDGIPSGQKGAGIGITGLILNQPGLQNTNGSWKYYEIYGKTGEDQQAVTVNLMLGDYGNLNLGQASFDEFNFAAVDGVPQGMPLNNLFQPKTSSSSGNSNSSSSGLNENLYNENTQNWILIALAVLAIYILIAAYYLFYYKKEKNSQFKSSSKTKSRIKIKQATEITIPVPELNYQKYLKYFLIATGAALLFRLVIAPLYQGYYYDYGMFQSWLEATKSGLWNIYYSGKAYVDYPPVYLMVLAVMGSIVKFFNITTDSGLYITMLKLPSIIADIATAYILFRLTTKYLDVQKGLIISVLYLFNPMIWFDTVIWGQVDSLFFLTIIALFWFIMEGKFGWAALIMTVSILMKPQGVMFVPVLFFELLRTKSVKTFFNAVWIGLGTTLVILVPFSINNPNPLWLVDLFKKITDSWQLASVNAFNFFTLFGGNWVNDSSPFLFLTYKIWGDIFMVALVAFVIYLYWKNKNSLTFLFAALILNVGIFNLSVKMHERYLYPTMLIALFIYICFKEKKALIIYLGATITNFLNTFLSFIAVATGDMTKRENAYLCWISSHNPLVQFISLLNVLLLIYIVKITIDMMLRSKVLPAVTTNNLSI